MRIALTGEVFVIQRYGGVSRYILELAKGLMRNPDVNTTLEAALYINEYLRIDPALQKHRGRYLKKGFTGMRQLSAAISTAFRFFSPIDIVHLSYYQHEALFGFKGKSVATYYDMIHERFSYDEKIFQRKRKTYDKCNRMIAISESTKNDMVDILGADPDKIDVVYLAANEPFSDSELEGQHPNPSPYLLWVGPRKGYKNFNAFLHAFVLSAAFREGIQIVCAGGPPFDTEELKTMESLGLAGRAVHKIPDEKELACLYKGALCLVYLSKFEGFGIPPLEAMQYQCPVIASNTSSIPEVVGEAGVLVDSNDRDCVVNAIDRVVFQRDLQAQLKELGKLRARQFSWDKCALETYNVYKKLLEI